MKKRESILKFYKKNKRMPSFSELMTMFGYKSKNSASRLVKRLAIEGVLEQDFNGKLIPTKLFGSTKLLGAIAAGFPSPAEEELIDTISLDEYLINNPEATFILKVDGDSMKDAGILPGDMVLVERGHTPKDGDVVVAEVDNQWTLKYFRRQAGRIILQPANTRFKPIYPESELRIAAIVKAVIRKY